MADFKLSTSTRTAAATAVKTQLDAGSGAAKVYIYDGTQPTNPQTAVSTQTKLMTIVCDDPCGTVTSGVLTFSTVGSVTVETFTGTKTASWARFVDSDENVVGDGDVTATGGGGDVTLSRTNITTGDSATVTSIAISCGNA